MKKLRYFVPAILFYLLIFFLSSQDGDIGLPGHWLDKIAHVIEFSLLGFFLSLGYFKTFSFPSFIKAVLVFFTGLPLAILDEWHQLFVRGRTSAIEDVIVDAAGIVCGILVYRYLGKRKRRTPEG
jgi:VanZ family protein